MIRKPSAMMWYGVLVVIGAVLALLMAPDVAILHTLHISDAAYRIAVFTVIPPYALIWFSAFYAYDKLRGYAKKVRPSQEAEPFQTIADGVRFLAWGLALQTIISIVLNAFASWHSGFGAASTILSHYIMLAVPLVGFTMIGNGTNALTAIVHTRPSRVGMRLFALAFIIVGTFFVRLVMHGHGADDGQYRLSAYPLLLTIIIPYLYAWFLGLLSAYELWLYAQKIKGVLYKRALARLSGGIAIVIVASIAVQYLTGVSGNSGRVSLAPFLVMVYCLLAVQAAGYALIAFGAKRLQKIEEV